MKIAILRENIVFKVYFLIVEFNRFFLNAFTNFSNCSLGVNIKKKNQYQAIIKARRKNLCKLHVISYILRSNAVYSFCVITRV